MAIWTQTFSTVCFFYGPIPFLLEEGREKGISVYETGLLASSYNYPAIVLGFFLGPISLKFGRKRLLVFSIIMCCLATTVFAFTEYI